MRLLSIAILAVAVVCDVWYGPLPFSFAVTPGQYAVDPARVRAVDQLRSLIPDPAVLSADYYLGSQFTRRAWLYWFPDHWADADYVLVDRSSEWTAVYAQQLKYLEDSPYHELAFDKSDIVLYRRSQAPPPPMAHVLEANFGNRLKLLGYTLDPEAWRAGDTLGVTLFWASQGPTPVPYTVFVHLLDPAGRLVSQRDSMPMSNLYPTTEWKPGETVVDRVYSLPISPQTAAGDYTLELGLYDLGSGERLDVLDAMGNPQDTRVLISGLKVSAP